MTAGVRFQGVPGGRSRSATTANTVQMLTTRAQATLHGSVRWLEGRFTHVMPARIDVGVSLVVDRDPVEGRLAATCAIRTEEGREPWMVVRVLTKHGAEADLRLAGGSRRVARVAHRGGRGEPAHARAHSAALHVRRGRGRGSRPLRPRRGRGAALRAGSAPAPPAPSGSLGSRPSPSRSRPVRSPSRPVSQPVRSS